jgi:ATP phosphoribosyltransferase
LRLPFERDGLAIGVAPAKNCGAKEILRATYKSSKKYWWTATGTLYFYLLNSVEEGPAIRKNGAVFSVASHRKETYKKLMTKDPLRLVIPKGSLEQATIDLFRRAGWNITVSPRSYFPTVDDDEIIMARLRAQEISRYVEKGTFDAGLTGKDWILENESDVTVIDDLVYSKVSQSPARWVLAVDAESHYNKPEDLANKRIATELVGVTKKFFSARGIPVEVEFSWGSTEAKVNEGVVDAIVDVTETGSTLKANGLRIIPRSLPPTRSSSPTKKRSRTLPSGKRWSRSICCFNRRWRPERWWALR